MHILHYFLFSIFSCRHKKTSCKILRLEWVAPCDIPPSSAVQSCPDGFFVSPKHYGVIFYATKKPAVYHCRLPSPPISLVISSILSSGNGGWLTGLMAIAISFIGLSSAAIRLELSFPHILHRWINAHSPFFFTHTATGSICPPHVDARSPGSSSTCRLPRQFGQWFRWLLPASSGMTILPQILHTKLSLQAWVL